jgi:hypothetical protein
MSLVDWTNGKGNARFWTMKMIIDGLGSEAKHVYAGAGIDNSTGEFDGVYARGFSVAAPSADGNRDVNIDAGGWPGWTGSTQAVLVANMNSKHEQNATLKGLAGGRVWSVVHAVSGWGDVPYFKATALTDTVLLPPLGVALCFLPIPTVSQHHRPASLSLAHRLAPPPLDPASAHAGAATSDAAQMLRLAALKPLAAPTPSNFPFLFDVGGLGPNASTMFIPVIPRVQFGKIVECPHPCGLMPSFNASGYAVNGGVPQRVNMSLHLDTLAATFNKMIASLPLTDDRYIDFDFEDWNPVWSRNQPIYQNASIDLVRAAHPDWKNETEIVATAKEEFESSAKTLLVKTIAYIKRLRLVIPVC